jgi:hypothetical protein
MNWETATHELLCKHVMCGHAKHFRMRCDILGTTKSGRLKLRVYGRLYWIDEHHRQRIRYVDGNRVVKRKTV